MREVRRVLSLAVRIDHEGPGHDPAGSAREVSAWGPEPRSSGPPPRGRAGARAAARRAGPRARRCRRASARAPARRRARRRGGYAARAGRDSRPPTLQRLERRLLDDRGEPSPRRGQVGGAPRRGRRGGAARADERVDARARCPPSRPARARAQGAPVAHADAAGRARGAVRGARGPAPPPPGRARSPPGGCPGSAAASARGQRAARPPTSRPRARAPAPRRGRASAAGSRTRRCGASARST